ncbi:MAG: 5-(carboxyamino)imidazole ribonucleotide mutase [Chloroflexi bacterium]|nr:5-(carboxyamino)imidazole ribonucleotide mutase [Chloroflexota bacterium]
MPRVGIVMGSQSDRSTMEAAAEVLAQLGVESEVVVVSAHRTPERARQYAKTARARGVEVLIAGAGAAAHLPGVMAAWTTLPVIGVPLPSSELRGVDALLAIVQMPAGIPVATVAVGAAGAKNAGYLAAQILGLKYPEVAEAYASYRRGFGDLHGEIGDTSAGA